MAKINSNEQTTNDQKYEAAEALLRATIKAGSPYYPYDTTPIEHFRKAFGALKGTGLMRQWHKYAPKAFMFTQILLFDLINAPLRMIDLKKDPKLADRFKTEIKDFKYNEAAKKFLGGEAETLEQAYDMQTRENAIADPKTGLVGARSKARGKKRKAPALDESDSDDGNDNDDEDDDEDSVEQTVGLRQTKQPSGPPENKKQIKSLIMRLKYSQPAPVTIPSDDGDIEMEDAYPRSPPRRSKTPISLSFILRDMAKVVSANPLPVNPLTSIRQQTVAATANSAPIEETTVSTTGLLPPSKLSLQPITMQSPSQPPRGTKRKPSNSPREETPTASSSTNASPAHLSKDDIASIIAFMRKNIADLIQTEDDVAAWAAHLEAGPSEPRHANQASEFNSDAPRKRFRVSSPPASEEIRNERRTPNLAAAVHAIENDVEGLIAASQRVAEGKVLWSSKLFFDAGRFRIRPVKVVDELMGHLGMTEEDASNFIQGGELLPEEDGEEQGRQHVDEDDVGSPDKVQTGEIVTKREGHPRRYRYRNRVKPMTLLDMVPVPDPEMEAKFDRNLMRNHHLILLNKRAEEKKEKEEGIHYVPPEWDEGPEHAARQQMLKDYPFLGI